jgi:hypothetical protein
MPKKRSRPEDIITKLRKADILKAARLGADSIKILGSSDVSTRAALSSPSGTVMVRALDCN